MSGTSESRLVALVGLRCVGKTSIGRELARLAGADFVDLDDALLELWRQESGSESPPEGAGGLLVSLGLARFRDLELRALEGLVAGLGSGIGSRRTVLATGGGCVETPAVRILLGKVAWCVWLREDLERLIERFERQPETRPALTDKGAAEEFAELSRRRAPLYDSVARTRVDGRGQGVLEVARRVLGELPDGWG